MNQAVNHSSGGKSIFALILGIPVFVILASSILYWMADQDVVELGTVNHGNLIQPPRPMMEQTLTTQGVDFEFPASRRFYVVDPYGWLMMSHGVPDTELPTLTEHGKKVLKDMKRLLK